MTIKLIVIDMDDTFLRPDKTYDEEKAEYVFHQLAERDTVIAIASGNYTPLLESYFDERILQDIYLASDDGNILRNNEEVLRTLPLNREDAENIYHYIDDIEGYYPIFSTGRNAYVKGPIDDTVADEISVYFKDFELIENFDHIPSNKEIVKMEFYCEHPLEDIKKLMKEIEEKNPGVTAVTSGEEWLDIYHENGGKGEAVKFLQDRYRTSKEETMCFGDSLNDRTMMKEADYSVAMENADDDLKEHCRFEIGTSEDQAVLDLLEQLINEENLDFLEKYQR